MTKHIGIHKAWFPRLTDQLLDVCTAAIDVDHRKGLRRQIPDGGLQRIVAGVESGGLYRGRFSTLKRRDLFTQCVPTSICLLPTLWRNTTMPCCSGTNPRNFLQKGGSPESPYRKKRTPCKRHEKVFDSCHSWAGLVQENSFYWRQDKREPPSLHHRRRLGGTGNF